MGNELAMRVDGHDVRREGDMWCLTDLWRAAGGPKERRPSDWLATDVAREFCEYVTASQIPANSEGAVRGGILKKRGNPRKGDPGSTWAHWQIALAYAKALSPAFHARVNEVYKAFREGQLVPIGPSQAERELIRYHLRVQALERGEYESVWDLELQLELARLRKLKWTGTGQHPKPLAFAYGKTWRIILGDAVYEALKARNPHPRSGSLHGQWLQEQRHRMAKREDMVIALVLARRSSTWKEYEHEMRSHFRRSPIQLRLPAGKREAA